MEDLEILEENTFRKHKFQPLRSLKKIIKKLKVTKASKTNLTIT